MSLVKNQHFVPQFYLKNFSSNKKQLYVFDKISNKGYSSAIDSVASARFFYDWKELDEVVGKQFIESTSSIFEGKAAKVLNALISRLQANRFTGFETDEKLLISEFIWYQMIRTPEARIQGNQLAKDLEQALLSKGVSKEIIKLSGLSYEDTNERLDHLRAVINPTHIRESVKDLCDRIWIIAQNDTNLKFYTSDNPVTRHTYHERGFSAFEIFFPLTPTHGLMILTKKDFPDLITFDDNIMYLRKNEYVIWYNEQQVFFAGRQIFSINNDFSVAKSVLNALPIVGDPKRPRLGKIN